MGRGTGGGGLAIWYMSSTGMIDEKGGVHVINYEHNKNEESKLGTIRSGGGGPVITVITTMGVYL